MKSRCNEKTLKASETSPSRIFKVMKERVRRARISKSLEELKLLILGDSSKIFKLDQADILEFTVKRLRRLRQDCKDVKDLGIGDSQHGGEKTNDGTSNDLENQENENICSPNAKTGCLKKSSTKRKSRISFSSSKINKKNKLTALRIDIPSSPARDTVITHTPITSAIRQSSLLVPLCGQDCVAPTPTGSVNFVSRSGERTERKPLAEISCNKFQDVIVDDAALWRPWS